jgi:hypothetical protein
MRRTLVMVMVMLVGAVAGAAPPEDTTRRLEMALKALDKETFAGTYRITTKSVVSKPDGSAREDRLDVMEITQPAGGEAEVTVVSATENGQDVTTKRRESVAKQRAKQEKEKQEKEKQEKEKQEKKDEEGSFSASMRLPLGEDLVLFELGPTKGSGVLTASFAPLRSARKEKNMTQGTLAWDETSGDPLWIEASYVDPPTGLKEMVLRLEIGREGDILHLRRTVTRGVGGLLWIKRAFDVEMTISDLTPAPNPGQAR